MATTAKTPHVLVLGGNFAGLGAARKIRDHAADTVRITVIDRKACLDCIPNIPLEIVEGRDPAVTMNMPIVEVLQKDDIGFLQAAAMAIDLPSCTVRVHPTERPGAPDYDLSYDCRVIAVGAELAYADIEGFAG